MVEGTTQLPHVILSMALHEESVLDPRFGDYENHDFAEYHIATNADVGTIDVSWIDEDDPYVNPMGAKGIGEIGIVGTAAAIANAVMLMEQNVKPLIARLLLCLEYFVAPAIILSS